MDRRTVWFAAAWLGALCAPPTVVPAAEFRTTIRPVDGEYIVVLKPEAARVAGESSRAPRPSDVADRIAAGHGAEVIHRYDHVLRGFAIKADDAALTRVLADPRVALVEENGRVEVMAVPWGLDRIDQRFLPLNGLNTVNRTGAGVHVYVVDSGIDPAHPEFAGRVGNGFDAVAGGPPVDCNGHGSNVAAVAGGATFGVARKVMLHPVRVIDCVGAGTIAQVISGLDWIAANHVPPAVANMSLGATVTPETMLLDTAVTQLVAAGVTVVAAAGNSNSNACNHTPGRVPAAITVSATDQTDQRAPFANVGACVDIFAPGKDIPSISGNRSGTSFAAPHVTGVAALYLQITPAATPSDVFFKITGRATQGVVINPGAGSPNRLLYTLGL